MKKLLIAGLASVGLMLGVYGTAEANLITNGSFEEGTYIDGGSGFQTLTAPDGSIVGWAVQGGSIDWIGPYWNASEGAKSIDLAGTNAHGLIVGTDFATVAGQTYRVQFDMAGNPDRSYDKALIAATVSGTVGGTILNSLTFTFDQNGQSRGDMRWVTQSFDFVADSGLSHLSFGDNTSATDGSQPSYGAAIDYVRVDVVPEPSTLLLLGAGFVGFGIFGRKFRRSNRK